MSLFGYHKDQVVDVFRGLARVHRLVSEMHQSRQHEADLSGTQFHDPFLLFLSEHILSPDLFSLSYPKETGLANVRFYLSKSRVLTLTSMTDPQAFSYSFSVMRPAL